LTAESASSGPGAGSAARLEDFRSRFPRLGSDEAGKGDFFGPLVVAAAYIEKPGDLADAVVDSKRLSDGSIARLAADLTRRIRHTVVKIMPPRYNELYARLKNINAILGWAHAQAIKNLLAAGARPAAILVDRFGPEFRVLRHLADADRNGVHFFAHGEQDPAVAAASIIARHTFVREMERLGEKADMRLPLGAGEEVDGAARALARKVGRERLAEFVKVHFKNFARI